MDEVLAGNLSNREAYRLLIGSVVPRPIAWVVSASVDRTYNVAPFSFFTVASPSPPTICFSVSPSARPDATIKDTLANVGSGGQLTVNIAASPQLGDFIATASTVDPEVDEFSIAGLTPEPSLLVEPPRIHEAPVAMECRLDSVIPIGTHSLVLARVLLWRFADGLRDGFYIDMERLNPLGRLAGPRFATDHTVLELSAPNPEDV